MFESYSRYPQGGKNGFKNVHECVLNNSGWSSAANSAKITVRSSISFRDITSETFVLDMILVIMKLSQLMRSFGFVSLFKIDLLFSNSNSSLKRLRISLNSLNFRPKSVATHSAAFAYYEYHIKLKMCKPEPKKRYSPPT